MTLNDLQRRRPNCPYFALFYGYMRSGAHCVRVVEDVVVKRVGQKTADHRRTPQTTADHRGSLRCPAVVCGFQTYRRKKKFTFAISSSDVFLVFLSTV